MEKKLTIHPEDQRALSPYLFGHNLEHTRSCVWRGLSAQLLRNRKFAGRPSARCGVAAEWFGIGDWAYFRCEGKGYVRHYRENGMRRRNETNSQVVQNPAEGEWAGIGQDGLDLTAGRPYELAAVVKSDRPVRLKARLTDPQGRAVYAEADIEVEPGDWRRYEFALTPTQSDQRACVRFLFRERAKVMFGAASLLPPGHFRGMRRDVVEALKEIGASILRWPGGNFAGEYRWQDMLLPVDMRAPLQAVTEDETQPYSHGYDMHEIDTDDYIALCREIGAEPFITVNLAWDSPEQCAAWVEYCNGPASSEYGRLRAERGHPEPYNVRFWSLGNEMGYGHMEGPMQAEKYAEAGLAAARAMLQVSPELQICSSGPYSALDTARVWIEGSAKALAPVAPYLSFHTYNVVDYDCTSDDGLKAVYDQALSSVESNIRLLRDIRAMLPETIRVSFDEWNLWAAWYSKPNALDGMYAANMAQAVLLLSQELGVDILCFFQPVNEGAIDVLPESVSLRAPGQVFALLKAHRGGRLCRVEGLSGHEAVATVRDSRLALTLVNSEYDRAQTFSLNRPGRLIGGRVLAAESLMPGSRFVERPLDARESADRLAVTLPPRSVALVEAEL